MVFPRTTEQVSAVMAAAHAHAVPVVPRGAGSGLSGGSNAIDGSLIVCLEKMADVLAVNEQDGYVETQPGVLNTDLREHVRGHGLWYAPDPASKDFCSIGGNVNTNAGGLCCVKYGVTREAVLGLEVVLADGRVTRLGRRTVKGVAGYDLAGMIVGSEGTLGIVTMARLRLRPLPAPPATAIAVFADIASAGRAVAEIMTSLTPSMLELMDRQTIVAVETWQPMGLDITAEALLVAQTDSRGSGAVDEAARPAGDLRAPGRDRDLPIGRPGGGRPPARGATHGHPGDRGDGGLAPGRRVSPEVGARRGDDAHPGHRRRERRRHLHVRARRRRQPAPHDRHAARRPRRRRARACRPSTRSSTWRLLSAAR